MKHDWVSVSSYTRPTNEGVFEDVILYACSSCNQTVLKVSEPFFQKSADYFK